LHIKIFLENEAQINKNNYVMMLFMSKQVRLPKISFILQKINIDPNATYALLARKPSISNFTHTVGLINCEHVWPFLVIYCHQWIFQLPSHLQELPSRSYINYVTVL